MEAVVARAALQGTIVAGILHPRSDSLERILTYTAYVLLFVFLLLLVLVLTTGDDAARTAEPPTFHDQRATPWKRFILTFSLGGGLGDVFLPGRDLRPPPAVGAAILMRFDGLGCIGSGEAEAEAAAAVVEEGEFSASAITASPSSVDTSGPRRLRDDLGISRFLLVGCLSSGDLAAFGGRRCVGSWAEDGVTGMANEP
eukprot:CAMPEP_0178723358 /NCGR_PEP_ID=MMETSP0699-20121125/25501_1 /TAXON_ID=265572 /ORGANISM="Extubocellulus spinifer, Strain CCMP396" /LENGTH=198 /DNA_ID=CAMNT_0020374427 /DNA_START=565 /DNA_END=1163 /DNA_ORIENTATION=-